jgi:hypothetical protein
MVNEASQRLCVPSTILAETGIATNAASGVIQTLAMPCDPNLARGEVEV